MDEEDDKADDANDDEADATILQLSRDMSKHERQLEGSASNLPGDDMRTSPARSTPRDFLRVEGDCL